MRLRLVQHLLICLMVVSGVVLIAMNRVENVQVAALSVGVKANGVFASDRGSITAALARRTAHLADVGVRAVELEIIPVGRDPELQSRIDAADGALIHEFGYGVSGVTVSVLGMSASNRAARWTYQAGWFGGATALWLGLLVLMSAVLAVLVRVGTSGTKRVTRTAADAPAPAAKANDEDTGALAAELAALHSELTHARLDFETRSRELEAERDKAAAADEAKSKFLATMSHELRTPLNAIIGFSEMMHLEQMGPMGNDRYKGYCGDILDSGRHLLSLVDDILDMSRLQVGKAKFEDVEIDIADAISSVVNLLGPESRNASVRLDTRLAPNIGVLWGDARAIRQILTNILGNAVRYSKATGHVTITAREETSGGLRITVADNGIGIAPEKLDRVFDAFVQGTSDYSRAHEGTGLGLAIAKSLVEFHDGSIEIESTIDVGTTVTLGFPPARVIHADAEADLTEFVGETCHETQDQEWLALEHDGQFHAVHHGSGEFLIGRSNPRQPELICDLTLTDSRVSRPHARIVGSHGQFFLVDQSRRGTYLARRDGSVEHVHQNVSDALDSAGKIYLGGSPDEENVSVISFVLREESAANLRKVV